MDKLHGLVGSGTGQPETAKGKGGKGKKKKKKTAPAKKVRRRPLRAATIFCASAVLPLSAYLGPSRSILALIARARRKCQRAIRATKSTSCCSR